MGMGSIAAAIALFLLAVGMVFFLIVSHTQIIQQRSGVISDMTDVMQRKQLTQVNITDVYHNLTHITFLVENTGIEKLHVERTDIFFGSYIGRNESNNTISLVESYNIVNKNLWDPGEVLNITLPAVVLSYTNYSFIITAENGYKQEITFRTQEENYTIDSASKTAGEGEDIVANISSSNDERSSITIATDSTEYLYVNLSLALNFHVYSSNLSVEHSFDNASDVTVKDAEYYNGTDWVNIGTLSPYESEAFDIFDAGNYLNSSTARIRNNYHSTNVLTVSSEVDFVVLSANLTRWWYG